MEGTRVTEGLAVRLPVPLGEAVTGPERVGLLERLPLLVTGIVADSLCVPEGEPVRLKVLEGLGVVLKVPVVVLVAVAVMERLRVGVYEPLQDNVPI